MQMTDWVEDFRQVTGQFVVRAREDMVQLLNQRRNFGSQQVELVIGSSAGNQVFVSMPTAEFGYNDVDYAAGDSAKITMPLMGLGTTNELLLQFF